MRFHRILATSACLLGLGIAPSFAATMTPALNAPAPNATAPNAPGAMANQTERGSSVFTDALNGFMAHGWHAVSHMHRQNGTVVATGVNAQGQVRKIIWNAGSDTVQMAG